FLELINFPESGELRVGRDSPPPPLRVRAVKWVVADMKAPEGWRALQWKDLNKQILGEPVPRGILPSAWQDRTVDQIELELQKPEATALLADKLKEINQLMDRLEAQVASPRMERLVRKLTVPDKVIVYYRGETTRSEQTLKKQSDNEYSGILSDL